MPLRLGVEDTIEHCQDCVLRYDAIRKPPSSSPTSMSPRACSRGACFLAGLIRDVCHNRANRLDACLRRILGPMLIYTRMSHFADIVMQYHTIGRKRVAIAVDSLLMCEAWSSAAVPSSGYGSIVELSCGWLEQTHAVDIPLIALPLYGQPDYALRIHAS